VILVVSEVRAHSTFREQSLDFHSTTRTIIDGRTNGFCKLVVDRPTRIILGCHVVGERAVEITQIAAVAMSANMLVDQLAQVPLSFPTYAGVLGRAAAKATRMLNLNSDAAPSRI
jgi:dihydrolipoamide dehydrogenase